MFMYAEAQSPDSGQVDPAVVCFSDHTMYVRGGPGMEDHEIGK